MLAVLVEVQVFVVSVLLVLIPTLGTLRHRVVQAVQVRRKVAVSAVLAVVVVRVETELLESVGKATTVAMAHQHLVVAAVAQVAQAATLRATLAATVVQVQRTITQEHLSPSALAAVAVVLLLVELVVRTLAMVAQMPTVLRLRLPTVGVVAVVLVVFMLVVLVRLA